MENLLEVTLAMRLAAEAGDFEKVAQLLDLRAAKWEEVKNALDPAQEETLSEVLAQDQQILALIQREQERIAEELAKLRVGQKALWAYGANR
jgi:dsDNA-binding SOS-regulon protein